MKNYELGRQSSILFMWMIFAFLLSKNIFLLVLSTPETIFTIIHLIFFLNFKIFFSEMLQIYLYHGKRLKIFNYKISDKKFRFFTSSFFSSKHDRWDCSNLFISWLTNPYLVSMLSMKILKGLHFPSERPKRRGSSCRQRIIINSCIAKRF